MHSVRIFTQGHSGGLRAFRIDYLYTWLIVYNLIHFHEASPAVRLDARRAPRRGLAVRAEPLRQGHDEAAREERAVRVVAAAAEQDHRRPDPRAAHPGALLPPEPAHDEVHLEARAPAQGLLQPRACPVRRPEAQDTTQSLRGENTHAETVQRKYRCYVWHV